MRTRLYRVELSTSVYVVACSAEDAAVEAENGIHAEQPEFDFVDVTPAKSVPAEWAHCLPFGEHDDRPCDWWVKK